MESTGVYWRPLYYLLEDEFTVLLVNMQHLQQVPGRKTDVRDSEWLAQLLECGLLRGSLVPPAAIRELRDLTRYRKRQIEDRAQEVNRLHRLLEDAGLKLASVMTDVMGVSGRAMVEALLQGQRDPVALAELARGRLRRKLPALREALAGRFRPHHAFLVTQILAKVDFLEETIDRLTAEIDERLRPFEADLARLTTIPGVARRNATTLLVETGADMARFPTAAHLCSWAAICPGQHESAGKRRTGKLRAGNRYLRGALIEAGQAATRAKQTALQARYYRVKRHRGHKKAVVAVGHQILEIAYYLLRDKVTYHELGPTISIVAIATAPCAATSNNWKPWASRSTRGRVGHSARGLFSEQARRSGGQESRRSIPQRAIWLRWRDRRQACCMCGYPV
jgi:transposase